MIESSGYVVRTLEAALWCCALHKDYRSVVLEAVNLGGDVWHLAHRFAEAALGREARG